MTEHSPCLMFLVVFQREKRVLDSLKQAIKSFGPEVIFHLCFQLTILN